MVSLDVKSGSTRRLRNSSYALMADMRGSASFVADNDDDSENRTNRIDMRAMTPGLPTDVNVRATMVASLLRHS